MKIKHSKINTNTQGTKAQIKNYEKLFYVLTGLYRDPVDALFREYISNAYDSIVEAGKGKIYVELKYTLMKPVSHDLASDDEGIIHFSIKDTGVGLSKERFENIFANYLESTKDDTDEAIGGFGLGAKVALVCSDILRIESVYDGVKRRWIYYKATDENDNMVPQYKQLSEEPCDEENYTKFSIDIVKDKTMEVYDTTVKLFHYLSVIPRDILEVDTNIDYLKRMMNKVVYRIKIDEVPDIEEVVLIYDQDILSKELQEQLDHKRDYTVDFSKLIEPGTTRINYATVSVFSVNGIVPYPIDYDRFQHRKILIRYRTGVLKPTPARDLLTSESEKLIKQRQKELVKYLNRKIMEAINGIKRSPGQLTLFSLNNSLMHSFISSPLNFNLRQLFVGKTNKGEIVNIWCTERYRDGRDCVMLSIVGSDGTENFEIEEYGIFYIDRCSRRAYREEGMGQYWARVRSFIFITGRSKSKLREAAKLYLPSAGTVCVCYLDDEEKFNMLKSKLSCYENSSNDSNPSSVIRIIFHEGKIKRKKAETFIVKFGPYFRSELVDLENDSIGGFLVKNEFITSYLERRISEQARFVVNEKIRKKMFKDKSLREEYRTATFTEWIKAGGLKKCYDDRLNLIASVFPEIRTLIYGDIDSVIEQLKPTKLWKEIAEKLPEGDIYYSDIKEKDYMTFANFVMEACDSLKEELDKADFNDRWYIRLKRKYQYNGRQDNLRFPVND